MKKQLNKILSIIVLLISAFFAKDYVGSESNKPDLPASKVSVKKTNSANALVKLVKNRQSGKIITLDAKVINILSDDNKGDRHQRLILKIGKNTLLLAHNIDLAPRVPVQKGDEIQVRGEYEWNDKGGIIHWTHRSTNNHASGWIKFNDRVYQ